MQIGREYVWVTEKDGKEIKIHVDKSTTKQDKMRVDNKSKTSERSGSTQ
jgi:hypothetical protein